MLFRVVMTYFTISWLVLVATRASQSSMLNKFSIFFCMQFIVLAVALQLQMSQIALSACVNKYIMCFITCIMSIQLIKYLLFFWSLQFLVESYFYRYLRQCHTRNNCNISETLWQCLMSNVYK